MQYLIIKIKLKLFFCDKLIVNKIEYKIEIFLLVIK